MLRYIVRRLLAIPFLILGVATLAFILGHGIKGDPLASLLSERQMGNAEVVAAVKARWGLDKSLPEEGECFEADPDLVTGLTNLKWELMGKDGGFIIC